MQRLTIIGRIGKDATTKTLDSGSTAISFSCAVTEKYKTKAGEEKTDTTWYNCTKWCPPGGSTKVADYIKKGGQVYLEGKVSARAHEGKGYLELKVAELELLGGKQSGDSQPAHHEEPEDLNPPGSTDDLPF